jgi:hypothetical protein
MRGKYYQKVLRIVSEEKYITWRKHPKNIKLLQNELCLQATEPHCMERVVSQMGSCFFFSKVELRLVVQRTKSGF